MRRILLAVRIGEESAAPAATAAWLARELEGRITLVYVAMELSTANEVAVAMAEDVDVVRERMRTEAAARARELGEELLQGLPFDVAVEEGDVARGVTSAAQRIGAHLIVAGYRGRSALGAAVLGDTTRDILRVATCPVVVVPPGVDEE